MCGIAGVIYADAGRTPERRYVQRLAEAVAHRGPDGAGLHVEPGVGLAHRRLAIIDLEGGRQPIANEDGSVHVVFNGEIYNYAELRCNLLAAGHRLRTRSDSEVLVHLYEEQGDSLVEHLRGMFAFGLWDRRRRRLLLARDRVGIKPLYWYRDSQRCIFGSELRSILSDPGVPREIEPSALEAYFTYGVVPGAQAIFRGIHKLPPAHTLAISLDDWEAAPRRYWELNYAPDESRTVEDWQEAIRAKIAEAVRFHLVADVPVGAFLSGGLDSSIVVSEATRASQRRVQTFSIGFREESHSELPQARLIAEACGTEHREEIVTPDAGTLLDDVVRAYDEPFADSSALPTYLLSRLASRSVKVVLSGDGGDEAFGGYSRYVHDLREHAVRACIPATLRRNLLGPLARLWPKADWLPRYLRAKTTLTNLSLDAPSAYANTLALCRQPLRRQLLHPDVVRTLNGHQPEQLVRAEYARGASTAPLNGMLAADTSTLLPDDFLVKVDRASMAHGLEVRPPLLDHELLELAARMPARCKVRGGETKWILRQAYRDRLPVSILGRRKQGFEAPLDDWLRGPLREPCESLLFGSGSRLLASFVNSGTLRQIYDAHCRKRGRFGSILWMALVFSKWTSEYMRYSSNDCLRQPVPTL